MRFLRSSLRGLGTLALFTHSVLAAPPIAFDAWKNSGTGITATCPQNFGCTVNGLDKDMMQRVLWAPNGTRYIQTIVDSTATDKTHMTSESFVNANNNSLQGISAKQVVTIPGTDNLTTTAILNTGWADDSSTPSIQLNQLQHSSYKGVGYASRFIYEGNLDSKGNSTGYYLDIRQEVKNSTAISTSGSKASGQDLHVFVTRKAGGDRVTAGSASLPASSGGMGGMMGSGGPTGGSVSWKNGNEVQVIWIGQICQGCQSSGGMAMGGGGGMMMGSSGSFSYQAYDNLSDGTAAIASRNFSTSPINWKNPPFGATPSITPGL